MHATADGEATVTVEQLGGGEGMLTVNGEYLGRLGRTPLFLLGGINKLTVTATSCRLVLDRLLVAPGQGCLQTIVYAAEDGTVTGKAKVTGAHTFATGGKAVDGIGEGASNALIVTVTAAHTGRHALTIRYSNGEQAPATHYNPDPVCRHADISVNGEQARRVLFPTTFHFNDFRDLTVPVTLNEGPTPSPSRTGARASTRTIEGSAPHTPPSSIGWP
ncbi:hypothetical protein [Streptomyces sp. NPDC050564]|uniref:hypothetical protein n=1 Tax=Streptomyces sp. NPDC050564 TaxID=3365631 RepID=UPI0037B4BEC4